VSARRAVGGGALLVLGLLAATPAGGFAQSPVLPVSSPTPAEASGYRSFTAPAEVGPYLERLAAAGEGVAVDTLPGPVPIPVVRIAPTAGGDAEAGSVVRVLVIGAQHGTERAGLEVGLRLARDLSAGPLARLRDRLEVRIVPMANPRAVELRRRDTPEGVDLDRDHVRLAAPETRALWAAYAAWRPHLVLDLHEIGPSEYPVQIASPTHPNAPGVGRVARFFLLPYAANRLARADVPFHEYVAEWVDGRFGETAARPAGPETRPEAASGADGMDLWYSPPPLEPSSARNAFALAGSVTFFVAAASSRDIIGLAERTDRLHLAVEALLTAAAGLSGELIAAGEAASRLPKDPQALRYHYAEAAEDAELAWIFVNDRGQREQGRLAPWRSEVVVEAALTPPSGWWLPMDHELVDVLRAHGFAVGEGGPEDPALAAGRPALSYPRCPAFEASAVHPDHEDERLEAVRGSLRPAGPAGAVPGDAAWVAADQPGARLLFAIVEPWSEGGWFAAAAPEARATAESCGDDSVFPVLRASR